MQNNAEQKKLLQRGRLGLQELAAKVRAISFEHDMQLTLLYAELQGLQNQLARQRAKENLYKYRLEAAAELLRTAAAASKDGEDATLDAGTVRRLDYLLADDGLNRMAAAIIDCDDEKKNDGPRSEPSA